MLGRVVREELVAVDPLLVLEGRLFAVRNDHIVEALVGGAGKGRGRPDHADVLRNGPIWDNVFRIGALAEGSWIDDRESVIFVGESGTGKTMLATALGVCACQQGRRVRFTTLAALANELQEAESRRDLARVVGRYTRVELLVLDELGYLALPDGAAELVFQVISERNERGSLIATTNLPFGDWTKVFPDPRLANAVVDRIMPAPLNVER